VVVVSFSVVPSNLHEMLVEMFRHRPSLAAEVLAGVLGMELPALHRDVGRGPVHLTRPDRQGFTMLPEGLCSRR